MKLVLISIALLGIATVVTYLLKKSKKKTIESAETKNCEIQQTPGFETSIITNEIPDQLKTAKKAKRKYAKKQNQESRKMSKKSINQKL